MAETILCKKRACYNCIHQPVCAAYLQINDAINRVYPMSVYYKLIDEIAVVLAKFCPYYKKAAWCKPSRRVDEEMLGLDSEKQKRGEKDG